MKLASSTVKESRLQLQRFNECPGIYGFLQALKETRIQEDELQFVDLKTRDYWANNRDTAVFVVKEDYTFVKLTQFVYDIHPDEYDYEFNSSLGRYVIRMWWD